MIELIITSSTPHKKFSFESTFVVIGSSNADLTLPEPSLKPEHLKIFEEQGSFTVVNCANDPFVTLNGVPFGKRKLQNHDLIQIGKISIHFEGTPSLLTHAQIEEQIKQKQKAERQERAPVPIVVPPH